MVRSKKHRIFLVVLFCTHVLSASTLPRTSKLAVIRNTAELAKADSRYNTNERRSPANDALETWKDTSDAPASLANRKGMMRFRHRPAFSVTSLVENRQQVRKQGRLNKENVSVSQHNEGRLVDDDTHENVMVTELPDTALASSSVTEWNPLREAESCCDHRRRRAINENACSSAKAPENWWCEKDFKHAGVCGCFGGFGTDKRAECAWCGKNVLQGDFANAECDFVGVRMHMTSCQKDAASIKETAQWFAGWEHYVLCEHGHVATGNATCGHAGGDKFAGYHQRWFSKDCNTVYIFFYDGSSQKTYAFSILTHLGETWRFKHEHWLHDTYIECDAISV